MPSSKNRLLAGSGCGPHSSRCFYRYFSGFISSSWVAVLALSLLVSACASNRKPTLSLIYASAALKAAERSQAEKRSPDLFNRAQNAYWKSKRLYLAKEFDASGQAAYAARRLAEQAELDAELKATESAGF